MIVDMTRIHLFEFTDMSWYPLRFRQLQTDYLQWVTRFGSGHKNLIPLIIKGLQHSETTEIVDLCSGSGGPWMSLNQQFKEAGFSIQVKLTDKFPNPEAKRKGSETSGKDIEYLQESVDAMDVPDTLTGMRTLFEGFHHFNPQQARHVLQDAVEKKVAIGIFEASLRPPLKWLLLILSPLTTLLSYFTITPWIRPRSFWRYFWTYCIPVVPLATCWDGVISILRVYSVEELTNLVQSLQSADYVWEAGLASTGTPIFDFVYLLGYPIQSHLKVQA